MDNDVIGGQMFYGRHETWEMRLRDQMDCKTLLGNVIRITSFDRNPVILVTATKHVWLLLCPLECGPPS